VTDHPVLVSTGMGVLGGMVSEPPGETAAAAVLLQGGGGFRFGPNRVWARAARAMAERGIVVLRVDYPGSGDSDLGPPSERLAAVRDAVAWFRDRVGADELLLVGSCYGARLAIHLAAEEPGVGGFLLLNPFLGPARPASGRGRRFLALPARVRARLRQRSAHGATRRLDPALRAALGTALRRTGGHTVVGDRDPSATALLAARRSLGDLGARLSVEVIPGISIRAWGTADVQEELVRRVAAWTAGRLPARLSG
jgi:pimeloyl-ACP methyl ester carboxylesterase